MTLSNRMLVAMLVIAALLVQMPASISALECAANPDDPQCKEATDAVTQKYGGCANPYPFLMTRYTPGAQSSVEGVRGITELNPDFACRLSKFLAKNPSVRIISAYRSNETQARLWNAALIKYGSPQAARKYVAPPGGSMHNKGLAADLAGVTDEMRRAAPADGLHFRMAHEGWHIEPLGAVNGGQPDGGSGAPSAAIAQAARGALGFNSASGEQQCTLPDGMKVPCSAIANKGGAPGGAAGGGSSGGGSSGGGTPSGGMQTGTSPQPTVCSPQFFCKGDDLYYRQSTCSEQLYQKCPNGCSGTSCTATPVSDVLATALTTKPTSTPSTDPKKPSVSVIDQIGGLADPTPVKPKPDAPPVILVVSGNDAARLAAEQPRTAPPAQSGFVQGQVGVQQTFNSSGFTGAETVQQNSLLRTLETMRQTVLGILSYLRPFYFRSSGEEHFEEGAFE